MQQRILASVPIKLTSLTTYIQEYCYYMQSSVQAFPSAVVLQHTAIIRKRRPVPGQGPRGSILSAGVPLPSPASSWLQYLDCFSFAIYAAAGVFTTARVRILAITEEQRRWSNSGRADDNVNRTTEEVVQARCCVSSHLPK